VKSLVAYVHNKETIIIVDPANDPNDLPRWNRNGELVIIGEGKHHDRLFETIPHRYLTLEPKFLVDAPE